MCTCIIVIQWKSIGTSITIRMRNVRMAGTWWTTYKRNVKAMSETTWKHTTNGQIRVFFWFTKSIGMVHKLSSNGSFKAIGRFMQIMANVPNQLCFFFGSQRVSVWFIHFQVMVHSKQLDGSCKLRHIGWGILSNTW